MPWLIHIVCGVCVCVPARAEACSTGQAMMQKKYMVSVRGCGEKEGCFGEGRDALYRLLEHDPHSALNAGRMAACIPIPGRSGLDPALGRTHSHCRFRLTGDLQCSLTPVLSLLLVALVYELFGGLGVCIMSVSFVVGRTEVGLNDISCIYGLLW